MGRKPNPLILEFFERGPKLEDASNRYQHTCKSCGEKFPKGRIDSLTTHLFKKCPGISVQDRQRASLQLHELPDLDTSAEAAAPDARRASLPDRLKAAAAAAAAVPLQQGPAGAADGTGALRPSWTPLETLAEVSRQTALSEKRTPTPQGQGQGRVRHGGPADDHMGLEGSTETHAVVGPGYEDWFFNEMKGHAPALPSIHSLAHMAGANLSLRQLPGLSSLPANAAEPGLSPDWMPAACDPIMDLQAELTRPGVPLEPGLSDVPQRASDKFFHPRGPELRPAATPGMRSAATWPLSRQASLVDPLLLDATQELNSKSQVVAARAATFPRPIAMNSHRPPVAFTSEFAVSTRQIKPKVRGRFTPIRRKEVQEVRKLGACIRCRMLKKPCSGGNPCSTCRSVESARLWKQPCVRTRIADELELYSAGVYTVLATIEVRRVKNQVHFHHFSGRIEAKHYLDSPVCIECNALEGRTPQSTSSLNLPDGFPLEDGSQEVLLLDPDSDELPGKLESYTQRMAEIFIDRETSSFMKPTLKYALELSHQSKDSLLHRALELWSVNHVWVDLEMKWITFEIPASGGFGDNKRRVIDQEGSISYKLLRSQLRAAAEKRAAQITKVVLNELERRLLQRAQSGWFETYLVAICLLSCVERSTWLFQSWDHDEFRTEWPLDRKPLYYYQQSERFADMLHMLLRMRGLPPKTHESPNGFLAAADDDMARHYFECIRISSQELEERQNASFDPENSRSLELKFCARLLLPTS
ncbi:MAG: hypothetical protein M1826_006069 [Phylliscum demangeonii]|nr:MAG: hypothetical protein M1826_006069 [Phylliscum demangeonii]